MKATDRPPVSVAAPMGPPAPTPAPVNRGRFQVTTVVDDVAAATLPLAEPKPSVTDLSERAKWETPSSPPPQSRHTLHPDLPSARGRLTSHLFSHDSSCQTLDDLIDPYATFPYAGDPRRRPEAPTSLELALAKIMRGYLRSSDSGDLSSLSQASLESLPPPTLAGEAWKVRVHVRDVETQTDRPPLKNASVNTATPATPSPLSTQRRFLLSMEPPTLAKARSLSSLSPRPREGCERCAVLSPAASPPWGSPCSSPPPRRSAPRTIPGSSERLAGASLVDYGRSLSLSQFLTALTSDQTRELEPEEPEDVEEFLKQLLARQQREREDLENRHRRELECLRQRLHSGTLGSSSAGWPPCEAAPNGAPGPPSRILPHSQSAPHFPRPLPPLPLSSSPEWHTHHHYPHLHGGGSPPLNLPASLERGLHRSNSEGLPPDPLSARPLGRTRTLTDDLLRLVQLNGAARTCPPASLSPEPKPTLHQLMQQRHVAAPPLGSPLKEGPPSPVTSPPPMYPPPHHLQFGSGGPRSMHRHQ
ncbi:hypothetical protein V5799_006186 [Amblyomma americanum]|uniref:Uncharacterized protein n=1 Tax=Amblyomma americanum TaxID=6943 RepID=A0AAQ4DX44_AMBAM